ALATFRECVQIAEKASDAFQLALAHESLGSLLHTQERFPEAIEHHRKELDLSTTTARAGYAAAHCADSMWQIGQYQEAVEMLAKADRAAEKDPDLMKTVLSVRAFLELSRRRFSDAAKASRKGLELAA